MAIRDNLTEQEIWEILIQYLCDFHDADVNSIAKYVYADDFHVGTEFYVIDPYDKQQRNKALLKCYKNDMNIHGEIVHFIELEKSEVFNLNHIIEQLELRFGTNELQCTAMNELDELNEDHPLRVLSHAFMLYEYERSAHLYKLRLNNLDIPNSVHDKFYHDQANLVDYSNVRHLHPQAADMQDFSKWLSESPYVGDHFQTFQKLINDQIFIPSNLISQRTRNKGGLLKPLLNENGALCSVALFSNNTLITHSVLIGAFLQSTKLTTGDEVKNLISFDLETASFLNSAIPLLKTNIYAGYSFENTLKFAAKLIENKQEVVLIIPDIYSRPDVRIINAIFDFLFTYQSESFSILQVEHKPAHKFAITPGSFAFSLHDANLMYGVDDTLELFYTAIDVSLDNKQQNLDNLSAFSKHHLNTKKKFNLRLAKTKIEQSLEHQEHSDECEFKTIPVFKNADLDQSAINWLSEYENSEEHNQLQKRSSHHIKQL